MGPSSSAGRVLPSSPFTRASCGAMAVDLVNELNNFIDFIIICFNHELVWSFSWKVFDVGWGAPPARGAQS